MCINIYTYPSKVLGNVWDMIWRLGPESWPLKINGSLTYLRPTESFLFQFETCSICQTQYDQKIQLDLSFKTNCNVASSLKPAPKKEQCHNWIQLFFSVQPMTIQEGFYRIQLDMDFCILSHLEMVWAIWKITNK